MQQEQRATPKGKPELEDKPDQSIQGEQEGQGIEEMSVHVSYTVTRIILLSIPLCKVSGLFTLKSSLLAIFLPPLLAV